MAEPSQDTRTPSADAVLEMLERLEGYLYALRPTVDNQVQAWVPEKHAAALAAIQAAGLDWNSPDPPVTGWSEALVCLSRQLAYELRSLLNSPARLPDTATEWFMRDHVGLIRSELQRLIAAGAIEVRKPDDMPRKAVVIEYGPVALHRKGDGATLWGRYPKKLTVPTHVLIRALIDAGKAGKEGMSLADLQRIKAGASRAIRDMIYPAGRDEEPDPHWRTAIRTPDGPHTGNYWIIADAPDPGP